MKTAQQSGKKFVERAGAAVNDYVDGVKATAKDPTANAVAMKATMLAEITKAINDGRWEKELKAAGKSGWQNGVEKKGSARYADGVAASQLKYESNSGKYDTARRAADSLPRGGRGSEQNLNRSRAVQTALRKAKVGA